MPKIDKAMRRDRKLDKKSRHKEDGRSVKLLEEIKREKADVIRKRREEKERMKEGD